MLFFHPDPGRFKLRQRQRHSPDQGNLRHEVNEGRISATFKQELELKDQLR
jgi:hypothetical protein